MITSSAPNPKQRRQRAVLELIAASAIGSQEELVERLRERGFDVTQATVSRDITELGLVKVPRGDRHAYVAPEQAARGDAYDARLRRLLEDIPVRVGRSGLSLVVVATPGSAGAIAQAIDQSSLSGQVGTLAGDNTLLVLFADEPSLERWLARFASFQPTEAQPWVDVAAPKGSSHGVDGHSEPPPSQDGVAPILLEAPAVAETVPAAADATSEPATNPVRGATSARALAHSEAPR